MQCSDCKKTFTRRDSLKRHSCDKHAVYACPTCGKQLSRRDALTRHENTKHKNIPKKRGDNVESQVRIKKQRIKEPIPSTSGSTGQIFSTTANHSSNSDTQNTSCDSVSILEEDFYHVESSLENRIAFYRIDCPKTCGITRFLEDVKVKSCNLIRNTITDYRAGGKIKFCLCANYEKIEAETEIIKPVYFNTCQTIVQTSSNVEKVFDELADAIKGQSEEYQERGSRFKFHNTSHFDININCYQPIKNSSSGGAQQDVRKKSNNNVDRPARMEEEKIEQPIPSSSGSIQQTFSTITDYPNHIELPDCIKHKKACINIQSNDNACLAWCLVAGLHPASKHGERPTSYPHYSEKIKLEGIEFPVKIQDIPKIEEMNNLSINVYALNNEDEVVGPVYFAQNKKQSHVNLLILQDGTKLHYVLIKNLSKLISSQITSNQHKIYLCDGCLQYFTTKDKLDKHCKNDCNHVYTKLPSPEMNILKFKNYNKKFKVPFVIYADFESLLERTLKKTETAVHIPYSFAYQIVCSFNKKFNKFETYTGLDCPAVFLSRLTAEVKSLYTKHMKFKKKMVFTQTDLKSFDRATECHICETPFLDSDKKVRDHSHLDGSYRGAAHSQCNLELGTPQFIPVFLHNLTNYDAHLFVKEIGAEKETLKVIAINKEKYISFSKNIAVDSYINKKKKKVVKHFELRFLDSFRFMPSSIEKLVKYLPDEKFNILRAKYPRENLFNLVKRKGIFPYDYMDNFKRLDEEELPPKEKFFNSLTNEEISDEDFEHAKFVWNTFECKSLRDYSNLYVETDVLLLADIFENFREVCLETYNLDPAHYYTAPGLSWDAMLKYTEINLELFTDVDMLHFVKNNIRGGLSQVSLRHAKSNNKYMKHQDSSPSSYLMYWDANNLYGWAMAQRLPKGGFRWLSGEEIDNFDVLEKPEEADIGYFLEVDLEYPKELHNQHNDLPFLVDKMVPPSSKFPYKKLIANLYDKKNYVLHYRNLKQAVENGLKISKIHRILEFEQSNWLQPYINVNTERRQNAKNDFEKEFYKLMNNSVFGKTIENIDKRVDVKLITRWEDKGKTRGARSLIAKPNFESVSIFSENLVGIQFLDLSKTLMYDFYYTKLKQWYQDKIKLCYTDTDSFIVHITTDDVYNDVKRHISEFDTSNYPQFNRFGIALENKGILGLFKDENQGRIQTEFVGLQSKVYANEVEEGATSKRAKGVQKAVVKNEITFDHYRDCLLTKVPVHRKERTIENRNHTISTVERERLALSAQDNKRYVLENGIDTLAWGHYTIEADEDNENIGN